MMTRTLLWCALSSLAACARPAPPPPPTAPTPVTATFAFVGVSVIPMDRERVLADQTVLIGGGRIVAVGPADRLTVPAGAETIDGRGKFLIPGLADMHVHLLEGAADLPLFVAYGVTTIRQMAGAPEILALRAQVNDGRLLGPTIFTVGPLIDGDPPVWKAGTTVVTTPEQARRAVDEQQRAGYDQVKVYDNLGRAEYDAVVDEAAKVHIAVVGHVPERVGLARALAAHQASIEHLMGAFQLLQRPDSPFRDAEPALTGMTIANAAHLPERSMELAKWVDETRIPELARATAAAGVWSVPTLVTLQNARGPDELEAAWKLPPMRYASRAMRDWWNAPGHAAPTDPATRQRALALRAQIVRALRDAGARLLVGTDTPHPFVLPGWSVHDEMRYFVEAGLTPYQALWAATRGPAELLATQGGTIAAGARADLVLLDGNPLADIAAAARIRGVVVRGRWLSRARLDEELEKLAARTQ